MSADGRIGNLRLRSGRFRKSLVWNVLAWLLPLTLIPTIVMGVVAYQQARNLLLDQITSQLITLNAEEADTLTAWVQSKQIRMDGAVSSDEFTSATFTLVNAPPNATAALQAGKTAIDLLKEINPTVTAAIFNHFFIIDTEGTIRASSKLDWKEIQLGDKAYFNDHIRNASRITFLTTDSAPLFISQDEIANEIMMVTSLAIRNDQGEIIGYAIGLSTTFAVQRILETNLSALPKSTAHLITEDNTFIALTKQKGLHLIAPSEDQIQIINAGSHRTDDPANTYLSFEGQPVVGIYEHYEVLGLGFMVEVPQAELFAQIDSLAPFTLTLLGVTSVILSALIITGTRNMLAPIRELVNMTRYFADGDWMARAPITRNDEIGLLSQSFNLMADELTALYRSLEIQVDERTRQILTAAEVANLATSAKNLDELLSRTVNLIIERFGYYHAAIFLLDEVKESAVLEEATGQVGRNLKAQGYRIQLNTGSIVSWVANNNSPHVASDVMQDTIHLQHELLPETHAEVGLPISIGNNVLGVLDVQSTDPNSFDSQSVEVLSTLANQVASAIQNFRLLEGTEIDLNLMNQLYRASRQIANSTDVDAIFLSISEAIQQTSYISAIYTPTGSHFTLIENPDQLISYGGLLPTSLDIPPTQAETYFTGNAPLIIRNVTQPSTAVHAELLAMPQQLGCYSAAYFPIIQDDHIAALIIMGSRERDGITQTALQPFASLLELVSTAIEKVRALSTTQARLRDLQVLNDFSQAIGNEINPERLYALIHSEIQELIGDVNFYIALYDADTEHISIPYLYEGEDPVHIDPFPLGEGLTSILIRTRQPLMLVENTEQRALALGAKVIGDSAKSWLGVPLLIGGEAIGVITVQDIEQEHRFKEADLRLLTTLATQIAGTIHSARLLEESKRRALQLQTAAEIARDTSGHLDRDELLRRSINLIRDRFGFYHASVFLLDSSGEYAVIQESTGEAGAQMVIEGHKLAVGSKSIIGHVTALGEPLVVNDVTAEATHRFNPLLPDTRGEVGIPIMLGDRVLGAVDVQSTVPYAFSPDDIEVLQILANQLAVAVANAELFTEIQENLAQHRLIHHVTTVAASSTSLDDSLSSAVQGLRVTLGDRVAILLLDPQGKALRISASAGYDDDILGMEIELGQGITGWVAENREALLINNVKQDPRYIAGKDSVRAELAVPLTYRGELLGVLNVESDELNAFNEHDQDILGTLAGSLAAITINARLVERQQQLFDVTTKIRRSVSMETILETTANELSRALKAHKIKIDINPIDASPTMAPVPPAPLPSNGKEGEA